MVISRQSQQKSITNAMLLHPAIPITDTLYLSTPENIEWLGSVHRENYSAQKKLTSPSQGGRASKGMSLYAETTEDFQQIMEEEEHHFLSKYPSRFLPVSFLATTKGGHLSQGQARHVPEPSHAEVVSASVKQSVRDASEVWMPSTSIATHPSRDYTHCIKSEAGFSAAVDLQLMEVVGLPSC